MGNVHQVGSINWNTVLDNYEPPREYAHGEADVWVVNDEPTIVLQGAFAKLVLFHSPSQRKYVTDAVYLLDDGQTIIPWYVAGWHIPGTSIPGTSGGAIGDPNRDEVILKRLPTNLHDDGTPVLRADDQRPVNFDNWILGPRRAWHLKITKG